MKLAMKSLANFLKLEHFILFLVGISLLGLMIIVAFSLIQQHPPEQRASIFGISSLIAIATFLSGLLIGFIFGIPRIIPHKSKLADVNNYNAPVPKNELHLNDDLYSDNSNLEQISDWLTTIIVGLGLINLTQVPAALQQFSGYIEPALGGSPSGGIFGTFILISYSLDGFLIGYLGTRRRAAVDFGEGKFEEEEIIGNIKTIQDPDTSKKEKKDAQQRVMRLLSLPMDPKQRDNNLDTESSERPDAKQEDKIKL